MALFIVKNSTDFAKRRAGVYTGGYLKEERQRMTFKSHCARLEGRRRFLELQKSRFQERMERRKFFERYSLKSLETLIGDKTAYGDFDVETKRFINKTFAINAKNISRNKLIEYMDIRARFPTKNMLLRYNKLTKIETRKYLLGKTRRAMEEKQNAFGILEDEDPFEFRGSYEYCPFKYNTLIPCPHHLYCGLTDRTYKQKQRVKDFNPKQNFSWKTVVPDHPYYNMNYRKRLENATIWNDKFQIELLAKYTRKRLQQSKNNMIAYTNLFKSRMIATKGSELINYFEKLSGIVTMLQYKSKSKNRDYNKYLKYSKIIAKPEMEHDDAHGEGVTDKTVSQNVVLTNARESSTSVIERIPRWNRMNTEDVIGNFNEMVDRWHIMDQFDWTPSTTSRSLLKQYQLPNYILTQDKFKNLISVRPFFNHRLWRGDMQIKVEVNSNKFQIGQLQCSFYYGLRDNAQWAWYHNVFTLSQCNHVLIDAGGSNHAIIDIPFRNQSAMIGTSMVGTINSAYIGTFSIFCLNQLQTVKGNVKYASITVNFKFNNCEFSGQIPADLSDIKAFPQMEALAMAGAMKLLDTAMADSNRDNPPAVIPPMYVVPTGTHNLSIATGGAEPLNPMRFDQRGQTHHPNSISMDSNNTVYDICRIFGLLSTVTWSSNSSVGSLISGMPVSPDWIEDKSNNADLLERQNLDPLRIMSNMFMQWRGSLEYRFDFVASQFHTGRVLVSFTPMRTEQVTLGQAMSSYNMQFDLQENRSFTFVVPYVHIDPWMRRFSQMDGESTSYHNYGYLSIIILNKLCHPQSVPNTIDINIYIRGGESFELSVPIQPSIGLPFDNRVFVDPSDKLISDDGQTDYYAGTWSGYDVDKCVILRWGTLAGRIITCSNVSDDILNKNPGQYFEDTIGLTFVYTFGGGKNSINIYHYVIKKIGGYNVLFACLSKENAIKAHLAGTTEPKWGDWKSYVIKCDSIDANPFAGRKMILYRKVGPVPTPPKTTMAIPEGERDESKDIVDITRGLQHTGFGNLMYGESFNSLKDLCRRYQLYGKFSITKDSRKYGNTYIIRFPVKPSGLPLDLGDSSNVNRVANKCREGIIPLILSGFRYYRGSIRFKIVFQEGIQFTFWIQHRPELTFANSISVESQDGDALNMYAHGYSSIIQCSKVNDMLEFEVPFYQPGIYGLLNPTNSDSLKIYGTNGDIVMGITVGEFKKNLRAEIYYSIGDDFSFSLFQGFPMMVDPSDVVVGTKKISITNNLYGESSMEDDPTIHDSFDQLLMNEAIKMSLRANPEMGKEEKVDKNNWLTSALGLDTFRENLNKILDQSISDVKEKFTTDGVWKGALNALLFVASQLVHVILNLNIKTVVMALVNIFMYMGIRVADKAVQLYNFVKTIFKRFFPDRPELQRDVDGGNDESKKTELERTLKEAIANKYGREFTQDQIDTIFAPLANLRANPEAGEEEDTEHVAGWFSIIFTSLTSILKCHDKGLKFDTKKAAEDFLSAKHMRSGNTVFTFVKLNYKVIMSMYNFIRYKLDPTYMLSKMFMKDSSLGPTWLKESRDLLSINMNSHESFDVRFADRVDSAILLGRSMLGSISTSKFEKIFAYTAQFEKKLDELQKLQQRLQKRGQYAFKRPKPLHIQLCGDPGLGKTVLADGLSDFILEEICEYQNIPMNKTCTVKASSKYWDQCTGSEPVVLLDDLWACTLDEILVVQIMNYIELYGNTVFSPPKAAVEDKEMRYAPKLVVSTTNYPYKTIEGVESDVLWRRRDMLIRTVFAPLQPLEHPACPHCRGEPIKTVGHTHLNDYHHLQFQLLDPMRENVAIDSSTVYLTYPQLCNRIKEVLQPIYNKNLDMYNYEVNKAMRNSGENFEYISRPMFENFEDYERYYRDEILKTYTSFGDDFKKYKEAISEKCQRATRVLRKAFASVNFMRTDAFPEADDNQLDIDFNDKIVKRITNPALAEKHQNGTIFERAFIGQLITMEAIKLQDGKSTVRITPEYIVDHVLKDSKCKFRCHHCEKQFFEGTILHDVWIGDKPGNVIEGFCQGYCFLDGVFKKEFLTRWLNFSPSRRIHLRNRTWTRLPSGLNPGISPENDRTAMQKLRDCIANFIDGQKCENSITMKLFKFVKYIIKSIYDVITRWLPMIFMVLGGVGATFGVYKGVKSYLTEKPSYDSILKQSHEEALGFAEQLLTDQHSEEDKQRWITLLETNLVNRKMHDLRGQYFQEGGPTHLKLPTPLVQNGLPALPQSNHYTQEMQRVPRIVGKPGVPRMAIPQASYSQQTLVAENRYRENSIYITAIYTNGEGKLVKNRYTCLQLMEFKMLSLRHYWEKWVTNPKDTKYYIRYAEKPERISCTSDVGIPINILDCERYKLCYEYNEQGQPMDDCNWDVITLPAFWQMCKNIVKFIAPRPKHQYVHGKVLFVRPGEASISYDVKRNPSRIIMGAIPGGNELEMLETYLYDKHAPGYCGSVIMSPLLERPIIGMHVAEWNSFGCAEPLYAEAFENAPTIFDPVVEVADIELLPVDLSKINIDTVLYPKGTVPMTMATQQSGITQYVKSIAHGEIMEVKTEPMPLSSKDPRMNGMDPMQLGIHKHGLYPLDFPNELLTRARDDLCEKILAKCKPLRQNVGKSDLQTAICGDANIPQFTALKWSSSEGYPLVLQRPTDHKGKAYLFNLKNSNNGEGYKLIDIDIKLKTLLSVEYEMRRQGIRCDTIYINCLKDELRSIEKARTPGKTRIFSSSPIQYIIAYRQYFGDFDAAYRANRIDTEHAIGINVDGPEWTALANYLQEKGPDICAGDYKHFGDTLNMNVMRAAFHIMLKWFEKYSNSPTFEEDQKIRGVLASEAMNVKRLCINLVYQSLCGLSSGFPATDILNSLVNCLYIRIAWMAITKQDMVAFNEHCNLCTYGDDLLLNIHRMYREIFNTRTIHEFFLQYNIGFTDIDKDGEIIPLRTLETAPFLKRFFKKHPTRPKLYLAKIEEDSIGSCLNWVIGKDDPTEAFKVNCRAALNLAYGHGPEYYMRLRMHISDYLRERNIHLPTLTWHEFDARVFDDEKM